MLKLTTTDMQIRYNDVNLILLDEYSGLRNPHLTKCHCGKIFTSQPDSVSRKTTVSCGCMRRYQTKGIKRPSQLTDLDNEIYSLHKHGLSPNEISIKINSSYAHVVHVITHKFNENFNRERNYVNYIDEYNIKCSKCKLIKHISNFIKTQHQTYTECNTCKYNSVKSQLNNDYRIFIRNIFYQKTYQKKYDINLNLEYLISLFEWQKNLCFYTGEKMLLKRGVGRKPNAISLDRIDNSKGYIIKNVVFCCSRVNFTKGNFSLDEMKLWMPIWYENIQRFYEKHDEIFKQY